MYVCIYVRVFVDVRACICACVYGCVCACVRACVRACPPSRAHLFFFSLFFRGGGGGGNSSFFPFRSRFSQPVLFESCLTKESESESKIYCNEWKHLVSNKSPTIICWGGGGVEGRRP